MGNKHQALVERIVSLPLLQAEWVLWLLFGLSALSLAIIAERTWFLSRRRVDVEAVRLRLGQALTSGHALEEPTWLHAQDSLETNVLARGLAAAEQGPDAVEELSPWPRQLRTAD